MEPAQVERVAESADILQIGARNMQNFPLLKEVGRTQCRSCSSAACPRPSTSG